MALHPAGHVISQIIEGEAIVINLENGSYFTFNGSGSDVWAGVESGADPRAIAAHLQARYGIGADVSTMAVHDFLQVLHAEQLVTEDNAQGATVAANLAPAGPFDEPSMQKFEDMQDLILLDPVHEVEEQQGWPHPRQEMLAPDGRI